MKTSRFSSDRENAVPLSHPFILQKCHKAAAPRETIKMKGGQTQSMETIFQTAPPIAKTTNEAPDLADLSARRALLDQTFEKDHSVLLNIISSYVGKQIITSNWQETREVAHEIFVEVYIEAIRSIEKFDSSRPPRAWLLGIALNMIKRKKVERAKEFSRGAQQMEASLSDDEQSEAEAFDRLAAASRHYHELVSPLEKQHALDEILSGVSESDREIIWLSVVCGLQSETIGTQLNISAPAARKRLQRALEKLRGDGFHHFLTQSQSNGVSQ